MPPTISLCDLRSLRKQAGDDTLTVEFDQHEAERSGRPCWNIYFKQHGSKHLLGEWRHPVDGNITAVAKAIRAANFSVRSAEQQSQEFDRKVLERKRKAMSLRMAAFEDATDYAYEAFKAFVEGKPSVGSTRAGCTGKA